MSLFVGILPIAKSFRGASLNSLYHRWIARFLRIVGRLSSLVQNIGYAEIRGRRRDLRYSPMRLSSHWELVFAQY